MRCVLFIAAFGCILSACVTQTSAPTASRTAPNANIDLAKVADSIRGSTKAQVTSALGPASVVRFDSGYEVWAYRFVEVAPRKQGDKPAPGGRPEDGAASSELVLLFAPVGVVTKVRIRPASTNQ